MERLNKTLVLALLAMVPAARAFSVPNGGLPPGGDPNRIDVVCLDAGHGGKDPGNLGTGRYKTTEKHIALNVTRLLGKYMTEGLPGTKVVYTREDDRFIELKERCAIANRNKADVFISIHLNAVNNPDPHGCETYVMGLHKTEANMRVAQRENEAILLEDGHELKYDGYDPKDPESMIALSLRQNAYLDHSLLLSSLIQKQFKDRVGRSDRGVKQAGFLVISYTTMPSVLIELGFLSNAGEEDFLQSAQGQEYLASAIYRAFKEYKAQLEGTAVDVSPAVARPDSTQVVVNVPDSTATPPKATTTDNAVRFRVQIVTSSKRIDPSKPKNFNGLEGVREVEGGGLFKYQVGDEPTLARAREVQARCREKGYDGAFIVAYQGAERIDLQKAVTLAQQH